MFKASLYMLVFSILTLSTFSASAQMDDPTRPPGYKLVVPGKKKIATRRWYSLSMVQISAIQRTAVVNDRFVRIGDVVNGAKVIGIYPSAVKLKRKGKVFTVKLLSKMIKKKKMH